MRDPYLLPLSVCIDKVNYAILCMFHSIKYILLFCILSYNKLKSPKEEDA